jgi:hypothetical protein
VPEARPAGFTVTVADAAGEVPPGPAQVIEYVVVEVGVTLAVPLVPEPVNPVGVHDVALVELHESVEDWPLVIVVGLADRLAVGAAEVTAVMPIMPAAQSVKLAPAEHQM